MLTENSHGVWLHDKRVGTLFQRGDHCRFRLDESYRDSGDRAILGLHFEQQASLDYSAALRLPPWFSNLLPEGEQRRWIAEARGVSEDREMELLAQVGHDLPGAVRVLPDDEPPPEVQDAGPCHPPGSSDETPGWRFSLAGVGLKFSMRHRGARFTLPAYGAGGDWIVKLPGTEHEQVPRNEFAMMTLASAVGIDTPEVRLVHRDEIDHLPPRAWRGPEEWAYAVRRFDRDDQRGPVHIEDLAQVRDFYPDRKYNGNYETVASLVYRQHDVESLREFVRRLTFCVLISNGDCHLKNWSLIYTDPRSPRLSPAYDLVSTAYYSNGQQEDLTLKFRKSRRFSSVSVTLFQLLERKLGAGGAGLAECALDTVRRVNAEWPSCAEHLDTLPELRSSVEDSIRRHSKSLRQGSPDVG